MKEYVEICQEFWILKEFPLVGSLRKEARKEEAVVQALYYCSQQTDKPRVSLCQSQVWKQMYIINIQSSSKKRISQKLSTTYLQNLSQHDKMFF